VTTPTCTEKCCEWCGEAFVPRRSSHRFCTNTCRYAWKDRTEHRKAYDVAREKLPERRAAQNTRAKKRRFADTYPDLPPEDFDNPAVKYLDPYRHAKALGKRSGLEVRIARELDKQGVAYEYEPGRIEYLTQKPRHYTPDFVLHNGIIIESKGYFQSADRAKHLAIKATHPDLDIRFVFSNPHNKLGTKSTTTYAMWCERYSFKWAHESIPASWLKEKPAKCLPSTIIKRKKAT
jgi:hypothetical protein